MQQSKALGHSMKALLGVLFFLFVNPIYAEENELEILREKLEKTKIEYNNRCPKYVRVWRGYRGTNFELHRQYRKYAFNELIYQAEENIISKKLGNFRAHISMIVSNTGKVEKIKVLNIANPKHKDILIPIFNNLNIRLNKTALKDECEAYDLIGTIIFEGLK